MMMMMDDDVCFSHSLVLFVIVVDIFQCVIVKFNFLVIFNYSCCFRLCFSFYKLYNLAFFVIKPC